MSRRKVQAPTYQMHRASGQARVRIDGRDHYLGTYGSPESRERYQELVSKWRLRHCDADRFDQTVDGLALLYQEHAKQHYRKDGRETSEVHCTRSALRFLVAVAGPMRAREFGPKLLKEVRERMIEAGHCRSTINSNVNRIRLAFRWGVAEEMVPATVLTALEAVPGLRKGRCGAIDHPPVRPVSEAAVEAIRPYVSRQVWAMVQLQVFTGMRPGEVLSMRGCDLNLSGNVWEYVPQSHKTEHHGRERRIYIGPRAQEVIRPFLVADLQAYLFSAREAVQEFNSSRTAQRKVPINCCNYPDSQPASAPKRPAGDRYDPDAYRVAIQRACERAFGMPEELRFPKSGLRHFPESQRALEHERRKKLARQWRAKHCWHPHQLRHNAATAIRRESGIETARCVLGHSSLAMAEVYAEMDLAKARATMARLG